MNLFTATPERALDRPAVYQAPSLTVIGRVNDVVLGVIGSGDDNLGYSRPEFEFEADGELPDGRS
jgi:hypothetical protein